MRSGLPRDSACASGSRWSRWLPPPERAGPCCGAGGSGASQAEPAAYRRRVAVGRLFSDGPTRRPARRHGAGVPDSAQRADVISRAVLRRGHSHRRCTHSSRSQTAGGRPGLLRPTNSYVCAGPPARTSPRLSAAGSPALGCWLLAVWLLAGSLLADWLLAPGCYFLAPGSWLLSSMPLSAPSSDRAPRHALNASGLRAELHALQPHDPALAREMEEAFHITDSNGRDNGPEPAMPDDEEYYSDGSSYVLSSGQEDGEPDQNQSLTRQLAETAVGVREMSKQLGRARVKSTIESVLIITKARDNQLITYTRDLALWLMLSQRKCGRGLIVYVDRQLQRSKRFNAAGIQKTYPHIFDPIAHRAERQSSSSSPNHGTVPNATEGQLRYWTPDLCTEHPELIDFVVTLGGDGTVLFASWLFQRIVPPVLPFSLGSLGFLTNFEFGQFKKVMESVLEDGIRVNMRMRFTATVYVRSLPLQTLLGGYKDVH